MTGIPTEEALAQAMQAYPTTQLGPALQLARTPAPRDAQPPAHALQDAERDAQLGAGLCMRRQYMQQLGSTCTRSGVQPRRGRLQSSRWAAAVLYCPGGA